MLSGLSGTLKYINLTNNRININGYAGLDKFCNFLSQAKNLHVLRMHKAWLVQGRTDWDDCRFSMRQDEIVDAIEESESRQNLRA